jgi:hypothetical protein
VSYLYAGHIGYGVISPRRALEGDPKVPAARLGLGLQEWRKGKDGKGYQQNESVSEHLRGSPKS